MARAVFTSTAGSSSTTLLFESLTLNSEGGPIIDDVRVSAAPEPGSLALLRLAGGLLLGRKTGVR